MGCSVREPDTGERRTNFGWVPALDLTPVSEMSLTGLFFGNYASGRGR
jgi:hypothetical protein